MIEITRVNAESRAMAEDIGRIMPFLKESHDGGPIDRGYLDRTARSISSVQLVATAWGREGDPESEELAAKYPVVGAATVSALHGALGEKAWLEDFVVVPEARKFKVAQGLWDAMTEWRTEKGLYQMRFNSAPDKQRAHAFYYKNGCQVLAEGKTTLFVHNIEV